MRELKKLKTTITQLRYVLESALKCLNPVAVVLPMIFRYALGRERCFFICG